VTHHPRAYRADACRCDECRDAKATQNATRERATAEFLPLRSERAVFDDAPWMVDGLCRQIDGDLWFPEHGESPHVAKRVCCRCSVIAPCLEFALSLNHAAGVWGGTTERERRRMRRAG
jgi:WhiB family redox-sensing transcriptional regulator